jgi:NAD(P)-dependent dehydrogenase (short-subunit alcohol dehydrogenase family)
MDLQLTDKVAVVTGANKRIGLAITNALVEEGAYVVAGSLTTENLEAGTSTATAAASTEIRRAPDRDRIEIRTWSS